MTLAILNEFWLSAPRVVFGIPIMALTHGFLNAVITIPCFYLAIHFEDDQKSVTRPAKSNVIFFDGFCVLCSSTVALLIKIDKRRNFQYSSLQGSYAQVVLNLTNINSGSSVIFYSDGRTYEKAEAVIHILKKLDPIYKLFGFLLNLLPLFILDRLYNLIAANRYRLFGKNQTCLISNETNRNLFIP